MKKERDASRKFKTAVPAVPLTTIPCPQAPFHCSHAPCGLRKPAWREETGMVAWGALRGIQTVLLLQSPRHYR